MAQHKIASKNLETLISIYNSANQKQKDGEVLNSFFIRTIIAHLLSNRN